jgi:hypothetical protein
MSLIIIFTGVVYDDEFGICGPNNLPLYHPFVEPNSGAQQLCRIFSL